MPCRPACAACRAAPPLGSSIPRGQSWPTHTRDGQLAADDGGSTRFGDPPGNASAPRIRGRFRMINSDAVRLLREYPAVASIDADLRNQELARRQWLEVPADTMLFDEGSPCRGFPMVLSGEVRVARGLRGAAHRADDPGQGRCVPASGPAARGRASRPWRGRSCHSPGPGRSTRQRPGDRHPTAQALRTRWPGVARTDRGRRCAGAAGHGPDRSAARGH